MELVLHRHVSREADEYVNRNVSAVVAQALEESGIHLAAGEMIDYIILDESGKKNPAKARPVALYSLDDGYDIEKYTDLALDAVETLVLPFGYDRAKLREVFGIRSAGGKRNGVRVDNDSQQELFR